MNPIWMLVVSLVVNALLLGAVLGKRRARNSVGIESPAVVSMAEPAAADMEPGAEQPTDAGAAGEPFDWSHLDMTDWFAYRDGLLGIGCPPATVRNILRPLVSRHYGERVRSRVRPYSEHFWERLRPPFEAVLKELEAEVEDIEKEERDVLKRLFEALPKKDGSSKQPDPGEEYELGFLPDELRVRVLERMEVHAERRERLSRTEFDKPAEQEAAFRALKDRLNSELAEILSADQLAELRQRQSGFARIRELEGVDLNESEMREVVRVWTEVETRVGSPPASESQEGKEAVEAILGPERAAALQRAQEPQFQKLAILVRRLELPPEQAVALWDAQNAASEQARSFLEDPLPTDVERRAALQQLQSGLREQVGSILGGQRGIETWEHALRGWLKRTYGIPDFDPVAALDEPEP